MNDPKSILDELKKAVVGKDNVLIMALLAILARGHILLEDIPGVGKTTMLRRPHSGPIRAEQLRRRL